MTFIASRSNITQTSARAIGFDGHVTRATVPAPLELIATMGHAFGLPDAGTLVDP